ncbi:MAG: hypothetical protein WDN10_02335 [bacterium]
MPRGKTLALLLGLAIAIILADVFIFGIGHVDTGTYLSQIDGWRHFTFAVTDNPWDAFRAFKPLYGVLGLVGWFLSPVAVLLVVNAGFLFGLSVAAYLCLERLGFSKEETLLGTFWVMTAYPALGLGFAAGTDISGWFFCAATIAIALQAIRLESDRLLMLASLVGFLGATGKETGVLGLVFAGTYLLLVFFDRGFRRTLRSLAALCLPFLVLEGLLLFAISQAGLPGFFGWVTFNNALYADIHTLKYFIGAELATFGILWLPAALGAYALLARRIRTGAREWKLLAALGLAALIPIAWPTFTDRILYIQWIALVPLALYGARFLGLPRYRWILYLAPVAVSAVLLSIGGHDGLYRFAHYLANFL